MIYAVEDMIARGGADLRGLASSRRASRRHALPNLLDLGSLDQLGAVAGRPAGNRRLQPYGKPPGGFLADYKRLVDFCSRNRIAAITIYGFLRDSHGGVEAAQELSRYATERGVRIMPGIAIGAYGGVYWEGDHKYNLATWLKQNPQFAATMEKGVGFQLADLSFPLNFPRSDYTVSACPSAPETIEWMEEAVSWLAETFDIGGINIESGDYGVCGCDRCVARRANAAEAARRKIRPRRFLVAHRHGGEFSKTLPRCEIEEAGALGLLRDAMGQSARPGCECGPEQAAQGRRLSSTPPTRASWRKLRSGLTRDYVEALPTQPNVLRCQFACQWNGDERTERYAFNAKTFADMAETGAPRRDGGADGVGRGVSVSRHRRALLHRLRPLHLGADPHLGAVHGRGNGPAPRRTRCSGAVRGDRRGDRPQPAPADVAACRARRRDLVPRRRRRQRIRPAVVHASPTRSPGANSWEHERGGASNAEVRSSMIGSARGSLGGGGGGEIWVVV